MDYSEKLLHHSILKTYDYKLVGYGLVLKNCVISEFLLWLDLFDHIFGKLFVQMDYT